MPCHAAVHSYRDGKREHSCTPSCAVGGSDRQHSTAEARPIAVSRNGDSAAARTASDARCISACTVDQNISAAAQVGFGPVPGIRSLSLLPRQIQCKCQGSHTSNDTQHMNLDNSVISSVDAPGPCPCGGRRRGASRRRHGPAPRCPDTSAAAGAVATAVAGNVASPCHAISARLQPCTPTHQADQTISDPLAPNAAHQQLSSRSLPGYACLQIIMLPSS